MKILDVRGLRKNFGGLAATSDVDFHVDQGEIVGLIGPNGAGKTTLFNLISGAITPDSGIILFKNKKVSGLTLQDLPGRHSTNIPVCSDLPEDVRLQSCGHRSSLRGSSAYHLCLHQRGSLADSRVCRAIGDE